MGTTFDDDVKQKILDSLAKESPMVISTAYAYAKNYVLYGEDITKAWTTAVQQASVIQEVRQKAWVEAYDSFKKEYENRLKADMVAMLTELQLEIEEKHREEEFMNDWSSGYNSCLVDGYDSIQQKIDSLQENKK
jgi:hypothetical protein